MTLKQEKKIAKNMKKYSEQFKLYCDETGWEDWMDEIVSGAEPTEIEIKKIENVQKDIWDEVFEK